MRKLTSLVLAAGVALSGCSSSRPYTESEKIRAGQAFTCAAADIFSTEVGLKKGYSEANPILGEKPTRQKLLIAKALGLGALFLGGEDHPEKRELIYSVGIAAFCGAAIHNFNLINDKKSDVGYDVNIGFTFKF